MTTKNALQAFLLGGAALIGAAFLSQPALAQNGPQRTSQEHQRAVAWDTYKRDRANARKQPGYNDAYWERRRLALDSDWNRKNTSEPIANRHPSGSPSIDRQRSLSWDTYKRDRAAARRQAGYDDAYWERKRIGLDRYWAQRDKN